MDTLARKGFSDGTLNPKPEPYRWWQKLWVRNRLHVSGADIL